MTLVVEENKSFVIMFLPCTGLKILGEIILTKGHRFIGIQRVPITVDHKY